MVYASIPSLEVGRSNLKPIFLVIEKKEKNGRKLLVTTQQQRITIIILVHPTDITASFVCLMS